MNSKSWSNAPGPFGCGLPQHLSPWKNRVNFCRLGSGLMKFKCWGACLATTGGRNGDCSPTKMLFLRGWLAVTGTKAQAPSIGSCLECRFKKIFLLSFHLSFFYVSWSCCFTHCFLLFFLIFTLQNPSFLWKKPLIKCHQPLSLTVSPFLPCSCLRVTPSVSRLHALMETEQSFLPRHHK